MNLTGRLLLALLAALAIHQAHATTVVAFYTPSAVFLGADSKVENGLNCKLSATAWIAWSNDGIPIVGPWRRGELGPAIHVSRSIELSHWFGSAVQILTSDIRRQLLSVLASARAVGINDDGQIPDLIVAGMERDGAHLAIVAFDHRQAPIECSPLGGSNCGSGYSRIVPIGFAGRIYQLLERPAEATLILRKGPADAVRYLISQEALAEPAYVGGPISVLRLDRSGIRWIDRGLCH